MFFKPRKTLEQEMEMRAQADLKRIEAETVARAKIERENQDLYLEQIRLKAKETRNTAMEGIRTAGSVLGAGAEAFLRDWDKVLLLNFNYQFWKTEFHLSPFVLKSARKFLYNTSYWRNQCFWKKK